MAIIKCPGCGGQLSTSAPACPRCQHVATEEEVSLATSIVSPTQRSVPVGSILSDKVAKATTTSKRSDTGQMLVLLVGAALAFVLFALILSVWPTFGLWAVLGAGIVGVFMMVVK